jgi:hypothetical protein
MGPTIEAQPAWRGSKSEAAGGVEAEEGLEAVGGEVGDEDAGGEPGGHVGATDAALAELPPGLGGAEPSPRAGGDGFLLFCTARCGLGGPAGVLGERGQGAGEEVEVHQHGAAGVAEGEEVADPLAPGEVAAGDGDFLDAAAGPAGAGDDLGLEAVVVHAAADGVEQAQGVDAEAALAVVDADAGLESDEGVGDAATDEALGGVAGAVGVAPAEDQGGGRAAGGGEEEGDLLGVELAVGVDGDGVGVAGAGGGGEAGLQGGALSAVAAVGQDGQGSSTGAGLAVGEELGGGVGGAVVDDDGVQALGADAVEDVDERACVVVGGRNDHRTERDQIHSNRYLFSRPAKAHSTGLCGGGMPGQKVSSGPE